MISAFSPNICAHKNSGEYDEEEKEVEPEELAPWQKAETILNGD